MSDKKKDEDQQEEWDFPPPCSAVHLSRERLPDERNGISWELVIGNKADGVKLGAASLHKGAEYISATVTTGEYDDGRIGELFVTTDQEGTFVRGVLDGYAILLSIALQYGIPLEIIVEKFISMRFEPSGMTNDKSVPFATSFFDFIFRKLALRYLDKETLDELRIFDRKVTPEEDNGQEKHSTRVSSTPLDERKESPVPKGFKSDAVAETHEGDREDSIKEDG